MEYLKMKSQGRIVVSKKKSKSSKIEKASIHPSTPKPPNKKKGKMYFGMDVQDAIVRYNALDPIENQAERNRIYETEIHYAFDKLCENIINTFKFTYFDDVYEDVKVEVVSFLVMNIHKYDHTKGSKAFSYFSVVAKNYLILHNNTNYKKYCTHTGVDALNNKPTPVGKEEYFSEFTDEMVQYFDNNISNLFRNKQDIEVAFAIVELMKKRNEIENFNKKALYILIREMTNIETSYITKVVNVFKKEYRHLANQFEKNGIIDEKRNPFF